MNKCTRIISSFVICAICFLSGCHSHSSYESDTVIPIPIHPTSSPEESHAQVSTTDSISEPTSAETAPKETKPPKASHKKKPKHPVNHGSADNNSGSHATTSPQESTAPTEKPPVTEAPSTEPPQTVPPVTELPETEPSVPQPTDKDPSLPDWYDPFIYDISNHSTGSLEYAILNEINRYRAEYNLNALTLSNKLCSISYIRAYEVSFCWSHTRPDGRPYLSALSDYGYGFSTAAENLLGTSGGSSASSIVSLWMSSDSHKSNILNPNCTTVGIGPYIVGGNLYVASLFVG